MRDKQRGFTLVELMIASTAFSLVLLIASSTAVQIGKLYYKGLIQSKTQETARNIADEITQSFQFGSGDLLMGANTTTMPTPLPAGLQQMCVGDTRYTYAINQRVSSTTTGVKAMRPYTGGCANVTDFGKELLGTNMRLLELNLNPPVYLDASRETLQVRVRIAYGDNDLFTHYALNAGPTDPPLALPLPKDAECRSGIAGSSFCAVSFLDNVVKKRLN